MKYASIFLLVIIGMISTVSLTTLDYSIPAAKAQCDWETIPGSDEITCVPVPYPWPRLIMSNPQPLPPMGNWVMLNPQPLPPMGNWVMLNPQPLPPIDCPMCGAFVLDKSLFEIASEVKITPQEDGSIVINAVMSNNTNNLDSANMTNQQ